MRTHEFMAVVRKVVASKPLDYVYGDDPKTLETRTFKDLATYCFYRHYDDTPGCVVGGVVAELRPELRLSEGSIAGWTIKGTPELQGVFTTRQISKLDQLQSYQDVGCAWHAAYVRTFGHDSWSKSRELPGVKTGQEN